MYEVLQRIADSEMPALLSLLILVIASVYYTVFVLPKLQRLKELEQQLPTSNADALELVEKVGKLADTLDGISQSVTKMKESVGDHNELLEDIQYSCHNTRHDLADVRERVQNIASTLGTEGRDDDGFCDLRELR